MSEYVYFVGLQTGGMQILSKQSHVGVFLLLLLLCSVCISPVMASQHRETIVEDGVHLVKFDDSPTILDSQFYKLEPNVDFIVDGDQFYWVRIGSVVAKGLTTVWWALWIIAMFLLVIWVVGTFYWERFVRQFFPNFYVELSTPIEQKSKWMHFKTHMLYSLPIVAVSGTLLILTISGMLPHTISHTVCGEYMDLQASDGTILLKVDKLHPETNALYLNSGVNLTQLTHLAGPGAVLNVTGFNPT